MRGPYSGCVAASCMSLDITAAPALHCLLQITSMPLKLCQVPGHMQFLFYCFVTPRSQCSCHKTSFGYSLHVSSAGRALPAGLSCSKWRPIHNKQEVPQGRWGWPAPCDPAHPCWSGLQAAGVDACLCGIVSPKAGDRLTESLENIHV